MSIKVNREAINQKVAELPSNIVAVEAFWDGDSGGWWVGLNAIAKVAEDSYKEHRLGYMGHGQGELHDFNRALKGETPPYPEGLLASQIGQEIADQLGVMFYFPSPEKPALDEVPNWIDWNAGRVSSIPIHLIDFQSVVKDFASSQVAIVEVYWGYHETWHPRMAIVTIENASLPHIYKTHEIGIFYWDDHDRGRVIHGQQIPRLTPTEEAYRLGQQFAKTFNTTFYFESSDNPRWHIPRWTALQANSRDTDSSEK